RPDGRGGAGRADPLRRTRREGAGRGVRVQAQLVMTVASGLAAPARVRGGVHVRGRVLDKVATEVAATARRVPRDRVRVAVTEHGDGAALRISAPLPIPDLDDADAVRGHQPVTERLRGLQGDI